MRHKSDNLRPENRAGLLDETVARRHSASLFGRVFGLLHVSKPPPLDRLRSQYPERLLVYGVSIFSRAFLLSWCKSLLALRHREDLPGDKPECEAILADGGFAGVRDLCGGLDPVPDCGDEGGLCCLGTELCNGGVEAQNDSILVKVPGSGRGRIGITGSE